MTMKTNEGEILRTKRKALGYTLKQVADMAGIAMRQYQRFEGNERDFSSSSAKVYLSICKVLEIDPYQFMAIARKNND